MVMCMCDHGEQPEEPAWQRYINKYMAKTDPGPSRKRSRESERERERH